MPFSRSRSRIATAFLFLFVAAGCAAPHAALRGEITVTGTVTVRGAEPFTHVMLEAPGAVLYVLDLSPAQRGALTTPSVQRAVGTPVLGTLDGRPFTHLRVRTLTPASN